jgi:hypothetical protein
MGSEQQISQIQVCDSLGLELSAQSGAGIGVGSGLDKGDLVTHTILNVTVAGGLLMITSIWGAGIGGGWLTGSVRGEIGSINILTGRLFIQTTDGAYIGGGELQSLGFQEIDSINIVDCEFLGLKASGGACIGSGVSVSLSQQAIFCNSIHCCNSTMSLESASGAGIGNLGGDHLCHNITVEKCRIQSSSEASGALIGGGRTASFVLLFEGITILSSQITCDINGEGNAIGTGSLVKMGICTINWIDIFDSDVNYAGANTGIGIGTLATGSSGVISRIETVKTRLNLTSNGDAAGGGAIGFGPVNEESSFESVPGDAWRIVAAQGRIGIILLVNVSGWIVGMSGAGIGSGALSRRANLSIGGVVIELDHT